MARTKLEGKNSYERLVVDYIENNASDMLVEKINNGTKTMAQCWEYIRSEAHGKAVGGCACISDQEVFGWAIHFFEEDSIKAQANYTPKREEHKEQKPAAVEKPKIIPVPVKKEEPKKITKTSSAALDGQIDIFAILGGTE